MPLDQLHNNWKQVVVDKICRIEANKIKPTFPMSTF